MMKGDREVVKRKKKVKEGWKESINQTIGGRPRKIERKKNSFVAVNIKAADQKKGECQNKIKEE